MSRKIPKKISKTKKKPINNSRRYKLYNEIRKITKKHPKIKQKIKKIKDLEKKLYYAMVWKLRRTKNSTY